MGNEANYETKTTLEILEKYTQKHQPNKISLYLLTRDLTTEIFMR